MENEFQNRTCKWCNQNFNIHSKVFSNHVRWCDKNPKNPRNTEYIENKKTQILKVITEKYGELLHVNKICPQCNKEFIFKKRALSSKDQTFCSRTCRTSYCNRGVRRWGKAPGSCLNCGTFLKGKLSKAKYCKPSCQHEYYSKTVIEKWLKGEFNATRKGEQLSSTIRKYLIRQAENKCSKCGWKEKNEFLGTVPLAIHHIDGDSTNSIPSNLVVLCPNCHSLTKTWNGLNTGKGRKTRREKRKLGLW